MMPLRNFCVIVRFLTSTDSLILRTIAKAQSKFIQAQKALSISHLKQEGWLAMKSLTIFMASIVTSILLQQSCIQLPDENDLQTAAASLAQTAVAEGGEMAQTAAAQAAEAAQTAAAEAVGTGVSAAGTAAAEAATRLAELGTTPVTSYSAQSNLRVVPSVTGEALDDAIAAIRPDSPLIGLGADFVRIGQEKQMNPIYIAAHAAWESTWGTSQIAQDKNNLFGYGAYDSCPYECAWTFDSMADSVETVMAKVDEEYLTEGGIYFNGATLQGMNVKYATDPNWADGIASVMNSIVRRLP